MAKLDPVVKRTRVEMKVGKQAAKKEEKRRKEWQKEWDKKTDEEKYGKPQLEHGPHKYNPPLYTDPNVELPEAVKQQAQIVASFYEPGRFHDLIHQIHVLVKELKIRGPSFRIATPGERKSLLEAYADITNEISKVVRQGA
jgi:hypothetical protein